MPAKKSGPPPGQGPDKEPGSPAATDGNPDANEFARRKAAREASGSSVRDRAAADDSTEPDEELFPEGSLEGDSKVSLKSLIKSNQRVEMTASMGTASVPLKTGFLDPEQEVSLLVRCLPGGLVPVATRKKGDEKSKIEKWRINQPLTPIYVEAAEDMYSRTQVLEMLHQAGVPSAMQHQLLGTEPSAAGNGA